MVYILCTNLNLFWNEIEISDLLAVGKLFFQLFYPYMHAWIEIKLKSMGEEI